MYRMASPDAKNKKASESIPVVENKAGDTGIKKSKKLWIIIGGALILLIAGGLIFAIPHFKGNNEQSAQKEKDSNAGEKKSAHEEREVVKATLALDPFLVNLADKDEIRFVKATLQFGLAEEIKEEVAKMTVAAMRDSIITLLTSKTAEEILTPQGKDKLREQVRSRINTLSPEIKVVEVYIVDFVVQL
jgi:flagellar protein FliL